MMKSLILNFFGEKAEIMMPTSLESLKKSISEKFFFSPSEVADLVVFYSKDIAKIAVTTEEEFRQFIKGKINELFLDVNEGSKLFKEAQSELALKEKVKRINGDLKDKVDPYLRPLYDALYEMLPAEQVDKKLAIGEIEIAPLAFMRGRTLADAIVILDEAQNTTIPQLKMFLTRLGIHGKMIVTGDLTQIDLPASQRSGLKDAIERLSDIRGISIVEFNQKDIVRHPLVGKIVTAYAKPTEE